MANDILVATEGRLVTFEGRERLIRPGDTVREGHPILVGREDLFAPLRPTFEVDEAPEVAAPTPVPVVAPGVVEAHQAPPHGKSQKASADTAKTEAPTG